VDIILGIIMRVNVLKALGRVANTSNKDSEQDNIDEFKEQFKGRAKPDTLKYQGISKKVKVVGGGLLTILMAYFTIFPIKYKANLIVSNVVAVSASNDRTSILISVANTGDRLAKIDEITLTYSNKVTSMSCPIFPASEISTISGTDKATQLTIPSGSCAVIPRPLTDDLLAYFNTTELRNKSGWSEACTLSIKYHSVGDDGSQLKVPATRYPCAESADDQRILSWYTPSAEMTFIVDEHGLTSIQHGKLIFSPGRNIIGGTDVKFKFGGKATTSTDVKMH
jgi:hypothetical protein